MPATPASSLTADRKAKYTPGPWKIVKSFNGFVITRTWTSGLHQRMRTPHLHSVEEAQAALDAYRPPVVAAA